MKKIFVFLLALSLLILCGCGGGDKTCTHADANTDGICDSCQEKIGECTHADENSDSKCDKCDTALTPATNLALVTDGVANFQFVITSSCREAKNVVYEQIDVINAHLAKDATMVNDVSGNEQALEIIIGAPVNRDAKYYVDEHYLGHKGYCIKVVDSKVLVLAGSAEMYSKAMEILVEDILGIGNRTGRLKNVSISTDTVYEKLTTDYPVESVTIAGTAIGEFVLAIDTNEFYTTGIAYELQPMLYRYLGVWLDIVDFEDLKEGQKAISFSIFENNDENKELEDYRMHVNEDGDLVFETKFPAKFSDCVTDYFSSSVIGSGKKKVVISATTERTKNLKDIYYSDKEFGAVGDGITDDFMAIKKCHDYANEWGHTVHATAGKTYYFGVGSGINTIEIKTDTYWHGAKFIFDDRSVVPYSDEYSTPIFTIAPDGKSKTYTGANLPFTSVYQGDTKVEWAPGVRTLIVLQSSDVRHFIRYGDNEDNGSAQTELLVIRPDGTIDPSTPVQWDYANITRIQAYPCDDKPITVSGGSPGGDVEERALVETLFNGAPSK
ncbi:MAG: hypothetical protein IJ515_03095 [Clostridia bacterium]|nr:hypothetical protein [Clostridia bacterium]